MKCFFFLIALAIIVNGCTGTETKNIISTPDAPTPTYRPAQEPTESPEPVAAPQIEDKIQGYWSSRGGMIMSELDDAERMKEDGINTVTFSPQLSHTQEGNVREFPGTELQIKRAINKAHEVGLRVMLETTPMNAGEVNPKVTDVDMFQSEMTRIAVKYAKIAEEYNVEYFSPIVEPVHHMSVEEADEWMQEVLPKIRNVYSGPVMWKKQSMHLTNIKEWNQDHIMKLGFKLDEKGLRIDMKVTPEHKISLSVQKNNVVLEEYAGDRQKLLDERPISLDNSIWHVMRVEIEGRQIRVFLDDELVIEHKDDSAPMGGYSIASESVRINQFEITDMTGAPLLVEDFKTLNNWNAQGGWALENREIVVTSYAESSLIHDIDFSGYDYIAIDTFKRGQVQTNEEYIEFLRFIIDKTNQQAESDRVPYVIIAEFGGSVMKEIGWIDVDDRAKIPMTEKELAQVTRMVLEIAEDTVDGYIYNGWSIEGQGIARVPEVEQVIKDWFTSH